MNPRVTEAEVAEWTRILKSPGNALAQFTAKLLAERAALTTKLAEAERVIAWANNSLFGSHGFFLSLDGGPTNEHHLDEPIEDLKRRSRQLSIAESTLAKVRELVERVDSSLYSLNVHPGSSWDELRAALEDTP